MKRWPITLRRFFRKDLPRRILIVLISFLLGAGIVFGVFTAYKLHEEANMHI